jgi:hypothetical protein
LPGLQERFATGIASHLAIEPLDLLDDDLSALLDSLTADPDLASLMEPLVGTGGSGLPDTLPLGFPPQESATVSPPGFPQQESDAQPSSVGGGYPGNVPEGLPHDDDVAFPGDDACDAPSDPGIGFPGGHGTVPLPDAASARVSEGWPDVSMDAPAVSVSTDAVPQSHGLRAVASVPLPPLGATTPAALGGGDPGHTPLVMAQRGVASGGAQTDLGRSAMGCARQTASGSRSDANLPPQPPPQAIGVSAQRPRGPGEPAHVHQGAHAARAVRQYVGPTVQGNPPPAHTQATFPPGPLRPVPGHPAIPPADVPVTTAHPAGGGVAQNRTQPTAAVHPAGVHLAAAKGGDVGVGHLPPAAGAGERAERAGSVPAEPGGGALVGLQSVGQSVANVGCADTRAGAKAGIGPVATAAAATRRVEQGGDAVGEPSGNPEASHVAGLAGGAGGVPALTEEQLEAFLGGMNYGVGEGAASQVPTSVGEPAGSHLRGGTAGDSGGVAAPGGDIADIPASNVPGPVSEEDLEAFLQGMNYGAAACAAPGQGISSNVVPHMQPSGHGAPSHGPHMVPAQQIQSQLHQLPLGPHQHVHPSQHPLPPRGWTAPEPQSVPSQPSTLHEGSIQPPHGSHGVPAQHPHPGGPHGLPQHVLPGHMFPTGVAQGVEGPASAAPPFMTEMGISAFLGSLQY